MKKFLLLFIVALPMYCSAQFDKLTLFTSGSGSFSSLNQTNTDASGQSRSMKTSGLTLSPKVGIFVIDKLLIGPVLTWTLTASKPTSPSSSSSETRAHGLTAGPFIRYYVFKSLFVQGDYSWGSFSQKSPNASILSISAIHQSSREFTAGAGYSIMLNQNKSIALDIFLAFQKRAYENHQSTSSTVFDATNNQSSFLLDIGLSGFLRLKETK